MRGDSDASMDRLLAGTMKARADAPEDCLDADTLAAWADDALDARERARVETHAADCPQCQAMLAAMVTTTPPDVAKSPWRMPALGWLVPLTVAATALVIWVAVPGPAPRIVHEEDKPETVDRAASLSAKAKPSLETQGSPADARAAAPSTDALVTPRERREADALQKQAAQQAAPVSANTLADSATPVAAPMAAAAPMAGAAPAAPPSAASESSLRRDSSPARLSAFAARDVVIVSTNPSTRFKLLPGGGVQRTADGGATWRAENTGATDTLTGGVSPSPSVCWLIGPAGTVLLSINGPSWRRVAFPERVDLRAITAEDADTATVTTVDGRVFVTSDGGRSWSRPPEP